MLSIGLLGAGRESYYLDSVAHGVEDYYTGSGEAPGEWRGRGSGEFGLAGFVHPDDLQAVLGASDPRDGTALLSGRGGRSLPGLDMTLSAPKSVSLLYAFGGRRVRADVVASHSAAVDAALGYLEDHATVTRRGAGGVRHVAGEGLVAAEFRHRTSRAGDPQLHSHVLVANLTRGADDRFGTLHTPLLFRHARTAGFVYQAVLRHELTNRLGVAWREVRNGMADVAGVDPAWCRHHARRRAEITARQAERGDSSARAAQIAALDTRKAKSYAVSGDDLQAAWEHHAREGGFEPASIAAALTTAIRARRHDGEAITRELASPLGLSRNASTFTRPDVVRAVAERMPNGATLADIELIVDRFLVSEAAVPVGVVGADHEERFSTPELLAREAAAVESALGRRHEGTAVVDPRIVAAVVDRRPELSEEQRGMVVHLLGSGSGVDVVAAKAGSGKTFALEAARAGWEAAGYRVVGTAVAGRAARELEADAAIPSSTLARFVADVRSGGLARETVVVVDEAGMAGTRDLSTVLHCAATARAKVVLVGDPGQLPAIDAGGLLRGLAARLDAVELTDNRRQRRGWEHAALDAWRSGDVDAGLGAYRARGRVVVGDTAAETRARLVADWWAAFSHGDEAVMLAPGRSDVDELNAGARVHMEAAGCLGPARVELRGGEFAEGDRVMCRRNDRRLGVTNGTQGWVVDVDEAARQLAVRTDDGRVVSLPRWYLDGDGERLAHAYALTIHKAQGTTVDQAFVLGDATVYRELGYAGASRHRDDVHFYVLATERDLEGPHGRAATPDALADFARALQASRADQLALDSGRAHFDLAGCSLGELLGERAALAARLRLPGHLTNIDHALASAERASAAARRRLDDLSADPEVARVLAGRAGRRLRAFYAGTVDYASRLQAEIGELAARRDVLVARLAERAAWVSANRGDIDRWAAVSATVERRLSLAVRAIEADPADHVVATLGPVPSHGGGRWMWREALAALESYRERWGLGPGDPLAVRPESDGQRADRDDVRRQVALARGVVDRGAERTAGLDESRVRAAGSEADRVLRYARDRGERAHHDHGVELSL